MTFDGENFEQPEHGDYDPLVAERFAMLDRLTVPDAGARAETAPAPVAVLPARRRFDQGYALAIAAAFVALAAASYVALRPSSSLDVDATNGGQVEADNTHTSAAVQDGAVNGELTVELPPSSTASSEDGDASAADANGAGQQSAETDEAEQPSTTTTVASSETTSAATGSSTTAAGDDPDSTSSTVDPDSLLAPPTTKQLGPGTGPDVPDTTMPADGPDQMVIIRGVLTELFTDCRAHYVLGGDGSVTQLNAVSCDGGSYVVVDGTRIQTSAGYVPAGQYYDRHDPALRPGQRVVVSATAAPQTPAALTLNCGQCGIALGG
ncbi:MAG: hypothetical protein AAF531_04685 [Actinomycetota bacterium]